MTEASFLDKVKNVIKETSTYLANGARNVPIEEYKRRADICNTCVHFVHSKSTCGVCGCLMHIKAKWQTSDCPKNKW